MKIYAKHMLIFSLCIQWSNIAVGMARSKASAAALAEEWDDAHARYCELIAQQKNPYADPTLLYDAGVAAYRTGNFQEAQAYFCDVEKCAHVESQCLEQAYFNAGNSAVEVKNLENALELYEKALGINPQNIVAQYNRDVVKKMLEEQQQQDQQQQESDKSDKNDQEQKQDKQQSSDQNNQQNKDSQKQKGEDKQEQKENKQKQNDSSDDKNNQQQEQQSKNKDSQAQNDANEEPPKQDDSPDEKDDGSNNDSSEEENNDSQQENEESQREEPQESTADNCEHNEPQSGSDADAQQDQSAQRDEQKSGQHENTPQPDDLKTATASQAMPSKEEAEQLMEELVADGNENSSLDEKDKWMLALLDEREAADQNANKRRMKALIGKKLAGKNGQNCW